MEEFGLFVDKGEGVGMVVVVGSSVLRCLDAPYDVIGSLDPFVQEAATIGVPDEKRGETVKSFIVLQPGVNLTEEDISTYCRENLAPYKIPRQVVFLDELPKSSVMKVLRRELRDMELAKSGA